MTEQELADLDALAAAATPGPWEQIDSRAYSSGTGLQVCLCNETDADAAFIAAARTAVPALVAEVRRLRGVVREAWDESANVPWACTFAESLVAKKLDGAP
ncbi:MAG: hypothetical protein ACK5VE_06490 [Alphaproteobacteria bacterium]